MAETLFRYHRSPNANEQLHPDALIAIKRDNNKLYFGYSLCNPVDQFSKEMARKIALGRIEKDNGINIETAQILGRILDLPLPPEVQETAIRLALQVVKRYNKEKI